MNVLTIPKRAAALNYSLLRLPATLVQEQLVVRLLQDDSALRLGFERALGSLDAGAGRLLGDERLATRGEALRRRADALADAARLDEEAAQRTAEAGAALQGEQQRVAEKRTQAEQTRREGVQQAAVAERDAKREVAAAAEAREQEEKRRIEAAKDAEVRSAKKRTAAEQARIDAEEKAATAAPKAQLSQAVQEKAAADEQRSKAETLASLAETEKQTRQAERAASEA